MSEKIFGRKKQTKSQKCQLHCVFQTDIQHLYDKCLKNQMRYICFSREESIIVGLVVGVCYCCCWYSRHIHIYSWCPFYVHFIRKHIRIGMATRFNSITYGKWQWLFHVKQAHRKMVNGYFNCCYLLLLSLP